MAELFVVGPYRGPGERKTVETLARDLPGDWTVIFGRALPGEGRDDLEILVVAGGTVFILEEKAWGPDVVADDGVWRTTNHDYLNPIDRVAYLARRVAALLRAQVDDYGAAVGRRHAVVPGVVLSHDRLKLTFGPRFDRHELVMGLQDGSAVATVLDRARDDEPFPPSVRAGVVEVLTGLGERVDRPTRIGIYEVDEELTPLGRARCFLGAADDGRPVVLRCYPLHGWGPDQDPRALFVREAQALAVLAERDRTWTAFPSFTDEVLQWRVTPLARPADARSLLRSLRDDDPRRIEGSVPDDLAAQVVRDAFEALSEVHELGLVHRGLHPTRILLGRHMRVKFSDFFMAHLPDQDTIGPWLDGYDGDVAVPYRAPECRHDPRLSGPASDVYPLALSLAGWVTGDIAVDPDLDEIRTALAGVPGLGPVLAACLADSPGDRPSAAEAATRVAAVRNDTASRYKTPAGGRAEEPVAPTEVVVGAIIDGRYRVDRFLGRGGFASSWLVYDQEHQQRRVLKRFEDEQLAAGARAEFDAAANLRHDRCARIWDIRPTPEPGALILDYVEGSNLEEFTGQVLPDPERYRTIATDILSALGYIHSKEMLHRDVSPRNIIVEPDGHATLIDFGLCTRIGGTTFAGTPDYMAPELFEGAPPSEASDLYSLAASLISCMLGRAPFDTSVVPPNRRSVIPPSEEEEASWGPLGASLLRCLFRGVAPEPAARPESAATFAELLRKVISVGISTDAREIENPTVAALRHVYRGSRIGNHANRGLDDEFARQTYVSTLLDERLLAKVLAGDLRLVLLTGNPGDGKTSFLVKVKEALESRGAKALHADEAGWRVQLDAHSFVAVYDASESNNGISADDQIIRALDPGDGQDPDRHTALIAVNDGRLLQFFTEHDDMYPDDAAEVRRQMRGEPAKDPRVVLVDLKRRSLANWGDAPGLGARVTESFVAPQHWSACDPCPSRVVCPIVRNVEALRGAAQPAVAELVLSAHLRRRRRATFRDLRSALAWMITGDRSCKEVHEARKDGIDLRRGRDALLHDLAFTAESADYLVQEWAELDPGAVPAPDVERAARLDGTLAPDPDSRMDDRIATLQRRVFFGGLDGPAYDRGSVRAYRHFDDFLDILRDPSAVAHRDRVLLGISRMVGASGYQDPGLAIATSDAGSEWSVLKAVPADEFTLEVHDPPNDFVEHVPDRVRLRHQGGAVLDLSLDTAEIILRAANGELLDDPYSDAIRQEIAGFSAQLRRRPASVVHVVDPVGAAVAARRSGSVLLLEEQ